MAIAFVHQYLKDAAREDRDPTGASITAAG